MSKKVVVLGGGHGQSLILKALKEVDDLELSAIVTVADSGGSTGRIRDLYNIPAMGDIRNVLLALARDETVFSRLFDYRFEGDSEKDVEGHNLGNLIITALANISGSFTDSILTLSNLLNIKGKVIPSTLEVINLYALMDDETIVKGEANIPSFNHHITKVFYDHDVSATFEAITAIYEADFIIYGIGSLYTSILPNIIIKEIQYALNNSKAKKIYFLNCMTQNNETFDYDLKDHVEALINHGAPVDLILKHSDIIPDYIRQRYAKQNSIEVVDYHDTDYKVVEMDLLTFENDVVRHDVNKVRTALLKIMGEDNVL